MFIDAKLLDIEATVERATAAIARTGAQFLTVHAVDRKMLDAARRGRGGLKLLGVTVLTNWRPTWSRASSDLRFGSLGDPGRAETGGLRRSIAGTRGGGDPQSHWRQLPSRHAGYR